MKRIRTGLIGIGNRGRGAARNLHNLGERYEIAAAADASAESTAEFKKLEFTKQVPVYAQYEEMIAREKLDAVVVSVPNHLHREVAVFCLENRLHLLLEKPMAITVAGCREIQEKARERNRVLQIGMELRFNALVREIRKNVRAGLIGDLRMLWCEEFRGPFLKKIGDWIIQNRYSGGTLVEKNCHHFDLLNWVVGARPTRVFASASHDVIHKRDEGFWKDLKSREASQDVIDNGIVTVDYENGVRASLLLCMFAPYMGHRFHLIGSRGSLEANMHELSYIHRGIENPSYTVNKVPVPAEKMGFGHGGGSEYGQYMAFYEAVMENKEIEVPGEAGLMAVAVGLAAQKSAAENRVVEIGEILGDG